MAIVSGENRRFWKFWQIALETFLPKELKQPSIDQFQQLCLKSTKTKEWKSPEDIAEIKLVLSELSRHDKLVLSELSRHDKMDSLQGKVEDMNRLGDILFQAVYFGFVKLGSYESIIKRLLAREINLKPSSNLIQLNMRHVEQSSAYQEAIQERESQKRVHIADAERIYRLIRPGDVLLCYLFGRHCKAEFVSYDVNIKRAYVKYGGQKVPVPFRQILNKDITEDNLDEVKMTKLQNMYINAKSEDLKQTFQAAVNKILLAEYTKIYQANVAKGFLPAWCDDQGKICLSNVGLKELSSQPERWSSTTEIASKAATIVAAKLAHIFSSEELAFEQFLKQNSKKSE